MAVSLRGTVVRGAGEGRITGYPTANLALPQGVVRPAPGIYACWAYHAGQRYAGALVSGVHLEAGLPRVEVHLVGFSGDLYGEHLELEVVEKIRDTMQFADPVALKQRIEQDIAAVRKVLGV